MHPPSLLPSKDELPKRLGEIYEMRPAAEHWGKAYALSAMVGTRPTVLAVVLVRATAGASSGLTSGCPPLTPA